MSSLRKYIRALLEADFGEKFVPTRVINPDGIERHAPENPEQPSDEELNTPEEQAVWDNLFAFLMGGATERADAGGVSGANMDLILQAMDDPKYNDVFPRYPAEGFTGYPPKRGSMMTPEKLDKVLPQWRAMVYNFRKEDPHRLGFEQRDLQRGYDVENEEPYDWGDEDKFWSPIIKTDYTYISQAAGGMSHWSRSKNIAREFAMGEYGGKELSDEMIPVILEADPNANDLLDMVRLYQYKPFNRIDSEQEIIGFGPIKVTGIQIYLPNYADIGEKVHASREEMKEVRKYIREAIEKIHTYKSHVFEPKIGDKVKNTNPGCKHYQSSGEVVGVKEIPDGIGKIIIYKVDNHGTAFSKGDVLEKTLDQLSPLLDINEIRKYVRKILKESDGAQCPIRGAWYGGMPAGGGFGAYKEYTVAAQRYGEAAHCILGSLGRRVGAPGKTEWHSMMVGEREHLLEEIAIMQEVLREYRQDMYIDQFNNVEQYREDRREEVAEWNQGAINNIKKMAPKLEEKATANLHRLIAIKESEPEFPDSVYKVALYTYQCLGLLARAMLASIEGWDKDMGTGLDPMKNAFKDSKLIARTNLLEKAINEMIQDLS